MDRKALLSWSDGAERFWKEFREISGLQGILQGIMQGTGRIFAPCTNRRRPPHNPEWPRSS